MQLFLPLNYELLTTERKFLFGIAGFWIFFRHTIHLAGFTYWPLLYDIFNIGDAGVDVFLFLSGFGLFFSYSKNTLKNFYIKRFLRIIPTFLVFYVLHVLIKGNYEFKFNVFLKTLFFDYWYILFIIFAYCLYPFIYRGVKKGGVLFFIICMILSSSFIILDYITKGGSQLTVYASRVPIFIIGSLFADRKDMMNNGMILAVCLLIGICALIIIPMDYKCFRRLFYLPLILGLLPFLCRVSKAVPFSIKNGIEYIGDISLEFYLVHCLIMVTFIVPLYELFTSQTMTIVTILGITAIISYLLRVLITPFTKYMSKLLIK